MSGFFFLLLLFFLFFFFTLPKYFIYFILSPTPFLLRFHFVFFYVITEFELDLYV